PQARPVLGVRPGDERSAAVDAHDQAPVAQDPHCPADGPVAHLILASQVTLGCQPARDLASLDLPAEVVGDLEVGQLPRVRINHITTLERSTVSGRTTHNLIDAPAVPPVTWRLTKDLTGMARRAGRGGSR